jgi:Protein of unknown function (DUF2975)
MTTQEPDLAMATIKRLSRVASRVALVGCIVLFALYGAAVATMAPDEFMYGNFVGKEYKISDGTPVRLACYALALGPLVLYLAGLLAMRRLMGLFENGFVFTERAAREITRIGWYVAMIAPVSIGCMTLGSVLLTWGNGPGARAFNFGISVGDILALSYGGLLIIIGVVMREAAKISDEHRQFV